VVGGLPNRRAFLRFSVPSRLVDSSTIVRATLLLEQRPLRAADPADTVQVEADLVLADTSVVDLKRASDLAAPARAFGVDSVRFAPSDSGTRVISIVSLVRAWKSLPKSGQRAIVLRTKYEGSQAAAVRFLSSESAVKTSRPRLRISYIPRTEFALP
jgi:hypothetical protein